MRKTITPIKISEIKNLPDGMFIRLNHELSGVKVADGIEWADGSKDVWRYINAADGTAEIIDAVVYLTIR